MRREARRHVSPIAPAKLAHQNIAEGVVRLGLVLAAARTVSHRRVSSNVAQTEHRPIAPHTRKASANRSIQGPVQMVIANDFRPQSSDAWA
jgi:hypothetical protein